MNRLKRKGIAIVAALGGIVVIGALIAGVFFVSAQESQNSGGAVVHERAFRAAELGLNTTLAKWDNGAMYAMPTGALDTLAYAGSDWVDTVVITKVTPLAFSILSSATAGKGRLARSRKQTLLNVRLSAPTFNFLGALTVRGPTTISGNSTVNGSNTNPSTWADCPVVNNAVAGVVAANLTDVTVSGAAKVLGSPEKLQSTAAADTTNYFVFGDENWKTLTAAATKVFDGSNTFSDIGPVLKDGACDTGHPRNWGSPSHTVPAHPCEGYFPIIHARGAGGSMTLTGNKGQGILLVDGNLEITGNFEFYGPVIVRGQLKVVGTGTKLNGGVMAANVSLEDLKTSGNSTVTYSSCAVDKARGGAASPRRITQRAWTEVH